jgi:predicted exporter
MKIAALAWVLMVGALCVGLIVQLHREIELQTDMTALLPVQEQDPVVRRAKDRVTGILTQHLFLLVGDPDREKARAGGAALAQALADSGLTRSVTYRVSSNSLKSMGEMYFPYRSGLLADRDRELLQRNQGEQIVDRAIANLYGPSAIADASLLRHDPFLLLPEFLSNLPVPSGRLTPDDGVLSIRDRDLTWVLLAVDLNGNAYSGDFQDRVIATLDSTVQQLQATMPHLQVLRVGTIFYAHSGAKSATSEAARLGVVSLVGTVVLILLIFRALRPLWLTLVAVAVGSLCAFAVCLWIFGGVHAVVLLFGVSLNGIAIDYCLQYVCARFGKDAGTPRDRLHSVLPGIALGAATTLIGYATLMLAPFPGLNQLAVFSSVGLIGSFLTIIFWLPLLDGAEPLEHGSRILSAANLLWRFWEEPRYRVLRRSALAVLTIATIAGATQLRLDDDVRHQQALAGDLHDQELRIRRLTGISGETQFLLVRSPTAERALQTEEALRGPLTAAQKSGALGGFQSLAQFIPSIERQRDNRALVNDRLIRPYLAAYYQRIGMSPVAEAADDSAAYLMPDAISNQSPISFLRNLVVESDASGTTNLVMLNQVSRPHEVQRIAEAVPGVRFVDPAGDISRLLGDYRRRATILIAGSFVLMIPILIWRYGLRGGLRVTMPPAIACVATPPLLALAGVTFTFFNAMALVLVLAIAFDYAVFCRETKSERRPATMLGIWLAMVTTLLSFGLLVFSSTYAVHAFGATLLLGTTLAFVLSPLAGNLQDTF